MNRIKFCLLYLYKLIISNPWKIILIILSLITYRSAGTFPDKKIVLNIADSLHVNGDHQYLYIDAHESNIEYKLYNSHEPTKVENGKITYYTYNDINTIVWLGFGISTLVLVIILIMSTIGDSDASWNFSRAFSYALSWFIKCDISDDGRKYSFHVFGKLIEENPNGNYSAKNISRNVNNIRDLKMLPKYIDKREERNKLLSKILN